MTQNQPASQPSGRTLAIGVAITISVIALVVVILVAGGSDNSAAETAYLDDVSDQLGAPHRIDVAAGDPAPRPDVDLAEDDRQPFIDAGYELCEVEVRDYLSVAVGSRAILQNHGLGEYANQWILISAAAADHLC